MFAPYLPEFKDLAGVLTTWGIGAVLLVLGTAMTGRAIAAEFRIAAGWGGLCLALTAWGVFVPVSLYVPLVAVLVAALAVQLVPARRVAWDDWRVMALMLAVSLPLWAVMAPIRPSQPDTFLNLLPNAFYLVDYARLPTAALPPSFSFLPAAPYNTQFLAFLGSLVEPGYPAAGMSLVNVLLQLTAGLAIARALMLPDPAGPTRPSWGLIALGMLLVTLLNPGFVPRFDFSAYGETALMTTALLAACLFVGGQSALADARRPTQLAALALILAAMLNAKQSGIGLVAALAGAAFVVGAAERVVPRLALVRGIVLAVLPAALLYAIWRYHVAHAGVDELTALRFAEWNWGTIPETLRSAGRVIVEKPTYFIGVAIALVSFPLLLRRQGWTPATRFLGFHAAAFVFYLMFLMVTYIAHFSAEMSGEAHSFFRYNTHLSLVLVLALALAAREFGAMAWFDARGRKVAAAVAIALALLAPIGFVERLRFDLAMPQPFVWDLAARLKPFLRDGDRLALLLPGDNETIASMLTGYLTDTPPRRRALDLIRRQTADAATLDEVATAGYDLALITCTPTELPWLPPREAALVRHNADGWHALATWPYPQHAWMSRWQRARTWPALCL